MSELDELIQEIVAFRDERDWEQFHTPEQLAAALMIEAAELQELFLWRGREEIAKDLEAGNLEKAAAHEIADVLIYALLFCDTIDIDPSTAISDKLKENARKYPIEKSRGSPEKYTAYRDQ